jgi:sterol desaturase/sphingolipid hydroxylase (fatty acid hydroxylase superfamily)
MAVSALLVIAAGAGLVLRGPGLVGGLVFLAIVLIPLERIWRRHPYPVRRPGLLTDIAYFLASPALGAVAVAAAVVVGGISLTWLPGLALRPLVAAEPGALRAVEAVLLFDLIAYWAHRFSHEMPRLWRLHAIHHSSPRLDWIAGIRAHPFDGAVAAIPAIFLVVAGFSPRVSGALVGVRLVTDLWAHLNVRWRLRPLQRLILTPEFHHWHHADEPDAINHNYSTLLPVWDIVFGTYFHAGDRRPAVYGVSEPIPANVPAQLLHPFRDGVRGWWRAA